MTFFIDDVVRTQPFSPSHFVYITLAIVACGWFIRQRQTIKANQAFYHKLLLWLTLVPTVVFYLWSLVFTGFGLPNGLPLHACRISTLLSLYYYFSKDQRVIPYLYYFGIYAYLASRWRPERFDPTLIEYVETKLQHRFQVLDNLNMQLP